MASYQTWVEWREGHRGHVRMSNGPSMDFSAPPSLHGMDDVLTPEDAFVAAINTCYMMMFLWACERAHLDLVAYSCEAEGFVREFLDRTSVFDRVVLRPHIEVRSCRERDVERALKSAMKYSLVAQSVKAEVVLEPRIDIHGEQVSATAGAEQNAVISEA